MDTSKSTHNKKHGYEKELYEDVRKLDGYDVNVNGLSSLPISKEIFFAFVLLILTVVNHFFFLFWSFGGGNIYIYIYGPAKWLIQA